jgi:hypothetical protein
MGKLSQSFAQMHGQPLVVLLDAIISESNSPIYFIISMKCLFMKSSSHFDLSRQHQNSVKTKSSNVLIPSWGVTILQRLLPRYALHAFYSYLYPVCPSEFWESHNRDVCNKKITIDLFASYVSWFQANVLTEISCCFQKLRTETEDKSFLFSFLFSKDLSRLLYTIYTHTGAGEVSGELHQLVIAICDEVDGLILCDWPSQGYDPTHSCFFFFFVGLAWTDNAHLQSVLWIVFCTHRYVSWE